jgi:hypothetical protein
MARTSKNRKHSIKSLRKLSRKKKEACISNHLENQSCVTAIDSVQEVINLIQSDINPIEVENHSNNSEIDPIKGSITSFHSVRRSFPLHSKNSNPDQCVDIIDGMYDYFYDTEVRIILIFLIIIFNIFLHIPKSYS